MYRTAIAAAALVAVAPVARADADNWPAFRGGAAAGTSDTKGLPDTWSATKNVVWKVDVPGRGWSSPIVWATASSSPRS